MRREGQSVASRINDLEIKVNDHKMMAQALEEENAKL
jgi:hypothetical protein